MCKQKQYVCVFNSFKLQDSHEMAVSMKSIDAATQKIQYVAF